MQTAEHHFTCMSLHKLTCYFFQPPMLVVSKKVNRRHECCTPPPSCISLHVGHNISSYRPKRVTSGTSGVHTFPARGGFPFLPRVENLEPEIKNPESRSCQPHEPGDSRTGIQHSAGFESNHLVFKINSNEFLTIRARS